MPDQDIYTSLAKTRGDLWSDAAVVDSTVTKIMRQKALLSRLSPLQDRIQV